MSLIHDALKKAQEKERAPVGSGIASFHEPLGDGGKEIPKRTLVLAGFLIVALLYFAYTKLTSTTPKPIAPPNVSATGAQAPTAAEPTMGEQDAGRLKRSGIDAFNSDDLDVAWNSFSAAAQLKSDDPEIWNNMGLVARKRGDVVKARESYQKALELKVDYPEALNNLAVLEMQAGNNTAAKDLLEKAVKLSPAYAEANFHLGLLYDQKGDMPKAIEYYKRFLEVGKNFPSSTVDSVRDRVMEIEP